MPGLEKAQIMFVLARRKGNWGQKYDRLEHFKRFHHLKEIIKDLEKKEWILVKRKQNFIGISLNTRYKKEIIEFIEKEMPHLKDILR